MSCRGAEGVSVNEEGGDNVLDSIDVSFVVPTFNEQESITELADRIGQVCLENQIRHQLVFVDDGSNDDSWTVIEEIATGSDSVAGIGFRRNFGKASALSAGINESTGPIIITMDADLQDDPNEIPRFLEKLSEGFDVVSGWKRVRHDPWHKTLPSRVFNALVSWLTGVRLNDHNCGFKAYRRVVFDQVQLYGERHRFVPVLAASRGWRVGEIEVTHHARPFGKSKYGVSRIIKGFLDLISVYLLTGYSGRPFHFIGSFGMLFFALGGVGIGYLSLIWCVSRLFDSVTVVHLHETAIFYYCILSVLLGAQFLTTGLLAELIVSRTSNEHRNYNIDKRCNH